ncbi:uncharacterized protein JCM6883_007240 [Sporobolomyces salmoneus]|uniref:uncharacterized protein n=1 Tax=Sporobolomyces salmoneus TaxID=183962 RepID=UPI003179AD5A
MSQGHAASSRRPPAAVLQSTQPPKFFLKDLVLGAAGSSDSIYDKLFDGRTDVVPVFTGWLACIVAAGEENRSDFTRKVLERCRPQTVFLGECILLRRKRESKVEDSVPRKEVYDILHTNFPDATVAINLSENPDRLEEVLLRKPYMLDVKLSGEDFEACYVRYHSTQINGTEREFRLLSGPFFILTRLFSLAREKERRFDMWEQLLIYLMTVHSLDRGKLQDDFHLPGHETGHKKWIELVVQNRESSKVGLPAHYSLENWLVKSWSAEDREGKTTEQIFREIATTWAGRDVGLSKNEIYGLFVRLRSDLIKEFKFLVREIKRNLGKPNSLDKDPGQRARMSPVAKCFLPQDRRQCSPSSF